MYRTGYKLYSLNSVDKQDMIYESLVYRTGYKLYSLNSVDKLDMIYESPCRDVTIVERLFSSSLIGT
jgi:autophagy-related protein 18